jgi:hypothetical protein
MSGHLGYADISGRTNGAKLEPHNLDQSFAQFWHLDSLVPFLGLVFAHFFIFWPL